MPLSSQRSRDGQLHTKNRVAFTIPLHEPRASAQSHSRCFYLSLKSTTKQLQPSTIKCVDNSRPNAVPVQGLDGQNPNATTSILTAQQGSALQGATKYLGQTHAQDVASLLDSLGEGVQNREGIIPVDAGVGDAHAVLEAVLALLGDLLVA